MKINWHRYIFPEKIPEVFVDLYDSFARKAIDYYYLETAQKVVSFCPQGRILDIGCGPGCLPLQIARTNKDVQVDGLDLSRRMVELARTNARHAGVDHRLNFFICDGSFLPVYDKSYDMVISTGVLHSLRNPVPLIDECHRVLKHCGEAWILDPARITAPGKPLVQKSLKNRMKLSLFFGISSLLGVFKPQQYTRDNAFSMLKTTRFTNYSISGEKYLHIRLIKQKE